MADSQAATLSIEGLGFRYDESGFELSIPSLSIAPGEHVACIGASGCGKTTLLHLAAGILLPVRGEVALDGVRWSALREAERRRRRIANVGLVFQELALLEHLTVRENMLLPYLVNRALTLDGGVEAHLRELARRTGIEALLDRRPRKLSQGERQRTAVCRALLPRPRLVLADEPTGNLDPHTSRRVVETVREEARRAGATVLFVTHERERLDEFDRMIDLDQFTGAATELGA